MKKIVLSAMAMLFIVSSALGIFNVKAVNQKKEMNLAHSRLYERSLYDRVFEFEKTEDEDLVVLKQINYLSAPLKKSDENEKERNYIFIGDSRTVNISTESSKYKNTKFFCQQGATYPFMTKAFGKALFHCEEGKENIIVSWFGINNPDECAKYVKYYNTVKLPENVKLIVMSITDGYDSNGRAIEIEDFNGIVQDNAENYKYLDITDKIGNGKELNVTDSARLHYTKNADKVFRVIMEKLEAMNLE